MKRAWPWIALVVLLLIAVYITVHLRKRIATWTWIWPVQGRVSSGFGQRDEPTGGASSDHNGIDIAAPIGTEVRAPADGIVTSTTPSQAGGKQLIIKHTNGWSTGYAHLSQVAVVVGEAVKQGDVVALTGNTGITTGPHLHLTFTNPAGQKEDPRIYLT